MRSLILQVFAIVSVQAFQENPIPSVLLNPRNFNPHPYQEQAKRFVLALSDGEDKGLERKFYQMLMERFQNTGPIRFPEDPNFYQPTHQQRKNVVSHIIDKQVLLNSPVKPLSKRPPLQTRYTNTDDQRQILAALANHAQRVQNNEFQNNVHSPTYTNNRIDDNDHALSTDFEKKRYNFAYAVKDTHSGDDFSHSQKQENGKVRGSYKVRLPDNRIQITTYIADEEGYRADVVYEEDGESPSNDIPQIQHEQEHLISSQPTGIHSKFYPQHTLKQRPQYTATPSPYLEYNHIRVPKRKSYPSTTSFPNYHY